MLWRTLTRLVLIPLGFALAAICAALVAVLLGLGKITAAMTGRDGGLETIEAYLDLLSRGGALLAGLTVVPALAAIIIGETARIRSWLYYMAGGGLAVGILPIAASLNAPDLMTNPPAALWQVLATAGFAGGLVYWMIAGRSA